MEGSPEGQMHANSRDSPVTAQDKGMPTAETGPAMAQDRGMLATDKGHARLILCLALALGKGHSSSGRTIPKASVFSARPFSGIRVSVIVTNTHFQTHIGRGHILIPRLSVIVEKVEKIKKKIRNVEKMLFSKVRGERPEALCFLHGEFKGQRHSASFHRVCLSPGKTPSLSSGANCGGPTSYADTQDHALCLDVSLMINVILQFWIICLNFFCFMVPCSWS